jgi:hypothetical protein
MIIIYIHFRRGKLVALSVSDRLNIDIQLFGDSAEFSLISDLRQVLSDSSSGRGSIEEIQALVANSPAIARAVVEPYDWHR